MKDDPEIEMQDLAADALGRDPRVTQARDLILAAVSDARSGLTGPRPARPDRKLAYARALEELARLRGRELYFP